MKKIFLLAVLLAVVAAPALATGNVTYTSPAGGEVWNKGSTHAIIYSFSQALGYHLVTLHRNGVKLGIVRMTNFPVDANQVINWPWLVGKVMDENGNAIPVPSGSGYSLAAGLMSGMVFSNQFTIGPDVSTIAKIRQIYYVAQPLPHRGGCPQCFILNLTALRGELVKWDEAVEAELFFKGRSAAKLGRIGKGQGFSAKLQVKLGPDVLEAVRRGEAFELRLISGRMQLLHAQSIQLIASSR